MSGVIVFSEATGASAVPGTSPNWVCSSWKFITISYFCRIPINVEESSIHIGVAIRFYVVPNYCRWPLPHIPPEVVGEHSSFARETRVVMQQHACVHVVMIADQRTSPSRISGPYLVWSDRVVIGDDLS